MSPAQVVEARGWVADCFGDARACQLSDDQVLDLIEHEYDGGLAAFVRDTAVLAD